MKLLLKYIPILLVFIGCKTITNVTQTEVTILIDGTDTTIQKPKFEEFESIISSGSNDAGIKFKVHTISDVDFGNSFEASIPSKDNTDRTDEEQYILKNEFIKECEKGYNQISSQATPKDHSIIYRLIATELNRLAKSEAKERILIVASDLFERSEFYNIYEKAGQKMLLESPEVLKQLFLKQAPFDSLNGITVLFTYQPKDFEQNKIYAAIQRVYSDLITSYGGRCKTGSILNLTN